jgi:hypothetical protein
MVLPSAPARPFLAQPFEVAQPSAVLVLDERRALLRRLVRPFCLVQRRHLRRAGS